MAQRASLFPLPAILILASCLIPMPAQQATNATYQRLREQLPGGEVYTVKNLELRRDAATFTFSSGEIAFCGLVNHKATAAVFTGEGHVHITPPTAQERHNLAILNHTEVFDESFDKVVLRFSDSTAAELQKGATSMGQESTACGKAVEQLQGFARHQLHENLDLRLLEDVLSPAPGEFFLAAIHGEKDAHLFFTIDPHGVGMVKPEEVSLVRHTDYGSIYLLAFHRAAEYAKGTASGNERNAAYSIAHEDLDVTIEKDGFLSSLATVELRAEQEGVAVIPLDLYPTLRVSKVETDKGAALEYVQEKKEDDPDFGVILAQPLKKGETATLKITYGGKDVVFNEGGGNYYPIAREDWYPNASSGLGDYATYHMLFHVPKGLQLIATGTKVSEKNEGKTTASEWKTEVPLAVVGFSLGEMEMKEAKVSSSLTIDAYANSEPPDMLRNLRNANLGNFSAPSMLPVELSQGQVAAQIYTNYFGALPFARIALTQQSACNYGQSWPMLVYLPICGFLDPTQQHFMHLSPDDMYWKVVVPHEVAHQWWGQTVGFRSYRDQWMSEGFAQTSASIFLQITEPKPDKFLEFWRQERKLITEKNPMGFRPIDVGPVTMGFRLSSPRAGWDIYQNLVYPKGAFILHMIRMMMWSTQDGDARFQATMHDLMESHRLQAATTEDFKAVVEKHMSPKMDLDGNHRMDWFFNEYVYGTDLPVYHLASQIEQNRDATSVHFALTQSGVPAGFKMLVPLYLELANGLIVHLGVIPLVGDTTFEKTVQLPKLPSPVKRAMLNYYYDVLSIEE